MSVIQVNQLKRKIEQTYPSLIDLSDVIRDEDKENCFLTRSQAAYTLQCLANIDAATAAACITDSYNDNGIDAIYYSSQFDELWILQSKWIKSGTGEPSLGDVSKFINGVKDLIELKFDRFNEKINKLSSIIENALSDYKIKIRIVLTYTGSDTLAEQSTRVINDLLNEVNEASEVMFFSRFSLKQSIQSLVSSLDGTPISKDIIIKNWEKYEEPYKAFLGVIDGATLAQLWIENRTRLFSNNIREFIGSTSVNNDIRKTAIEEPENFFYYNNGVTILCDEINKQAAGGADHSFGTFHVENMKVVNGAQTVGSLGEAYGTNKDSVEKTNVFVKIISLQSCPDSFGENVTRKNNTQNRIEKRDFVSLDPQHERIKTDMALDGITYQIKRSDTLTNDEKSCTVDELITAVACSLSNVDISIVAKREVGLLYDNITTSPYTDIVNASLSATKAWRCITIMRLLTAFIKQKEPQVTGREKSCYIHSNRFVLHLILNKMDPQVLNDPKFDFDSYCKNELIAKFEQYEVLIYQIIEEKYSSSLIHQIFRNYTKTRDIKNEFINRAAII